MKTYSKKDIAIVVPIYKLNFTYLEKLSLNILKKKLGKYAFYLVCPKSLIKSVKKNPLLKNFSIFEVENNFLESKKGYNSLLKKPFFYKHFIKYKYILIYQIDCLVFKDNLLSFCNRDLDYWGAPIFRYNLNGSIRKGIVGNGGLSLRKVKSFLYICEKFSSISGKLKLGLLKSIQLPSHIFDFFLSRKPRAISHLFTKNEDMFWSLDARIFLPSFKKPSLKEAALFSIEREKNICFKLNKGKIPFGCHAFNKYYTNFWLSKLKILKK